MSKVNVYKHIKRVKDGAGRTIGYEVIRDFEYFSKRYSKMVVARVGDPYYDGATGAIDINSYGWLVHDVLCRDGTFDDGTPCTNLQASTVLSDILADEGRWFRRISWWASTWLLGGGKARDNGMW